MKQILLFLLFTGHIINGHAQSEIEVKVNIMVDSPKDTPLFPTKYQIVFYTANDTFNLVTDGHGVLEMSTKDEQPIIALNQQYSYVVYEGKQYLGEDTFGTFVEQNTRIFRDFKPIHFVCRKTYNPIGFKSNSLNLTPQGKKDFARLSVFLEEQENVVLELYGIANKNTSGLQAVAQANKIRDSLIFEGHFADRLAINKPRRTDGESKVGFSIISFDYTPCTGSSVVNFDKATDTIVETRCDSLQFIANYLNIQEETFAVIGVYTVKDNRVEKQKAIQRAELVRAKLISLGVDENRLRVTTSYHEEPGLNDHRDWPFYPLNYSYEIGVYILGDY